MNRAMSGRSAPDRVQNDRGESAERARLVNIGCGASLHADWINLDVYASAPGVIVHDIRDGLPFADRSIEVCYHSHILEHLTPARAGHLIGECYRVLRPGGVIRVVVPDLERIARYYLEALEGAVNRVAGAEGRYDWSVLELLDQIVRDRSGGEIGRALSEERFDRNFVRARVGSEAEQLWANIALRPAQSRWRRALQGLTRSPPRRVLASVLRSAREGTFAAAVREGIFRSSGEVHRWMYDEFSLGRLMARSGFSDVRRRSATESEVPNFDSYQLDSVDGRVRKPDSLFMEALRPAEVMAAGRPRAG